MNRARILVLALSCVACADAPERPSGVILVSIDTLRADHLGCYGYHRPTSPHLDRLAAESVVFERVSSAAPSTLSSHASLLTSSIPQHHGASHIRRRPLPATGPATLAEVFRAAGWRTAAFHDGAQLAPEFGLDRGFESYERVPHAGRNARFEDTVLQALEWLDGHDVEPFFLFLHTYEVHHPYLPRLAAWKALAPPGLAPEPIEIELLRAINQGQVALSQELAERIVLAYDTEIRQVDAAFGRLRAGLEARGVWERSLVVVTSDHGEELGDHGRMGWHSHTVFEELLAVPLLIAGSGLPAERVATRARSIDIAPTVLTLAGLDPPPTFEGLSLLPLDRRVAMLPAIAFGETEQRSFAAIRIGRWKLADGRLFDLDDDPTERHDVAASETALTAELAARLAGAEAQAPAEVLPLDLEPETEDALRALGYVTRSEP